MCFKNLPIEFDERGNARLRDGVRNPYALDGPQPQGFTKSRAVSGGSSVRTEPRVRDWMIDPVTRVAGALAVHCELDLDARQATEAHSMAMLFRGYELILQGRDPRDAIDISSRACGVCGGVHASVASQAMDMAFGITPPPLGIVARNLGEGAEMLYDHPIHLGLLAGPDYSTPLVQVTNPELVRKAENTLAPNSGIHGFETIKDIMDGMAPLTGRIYLEALEFTRLGREMCSMFYGKFPHPSTLVPGGVTTTITTSTFNNFYTRLVKFIDYSKRIALFWDDILDFFLEADPNYEQVGARPSNLIQLGIWDDPKVYTGRYADLDAFGNARWASPGCIVNGELVTTDLTRINMGLEEFVDHSFYEDWTGDGQKHATDELGNPLSPYHMWNKITIPKPEGRNFKERYTWSVAPRWDRQVMETGVYGRMWTTALAQQMRVNDFIEPTGHSLKMLLPAGELPELELEWKIPRTLNAFERNRGRAYGVAWTSLITLNCLLEAFDLLRDGETKTSTKFKVPKDHRMAAGFWEAGRGYLSHHMEMDKGKLTNYQISTPSTFNASPRDPFGNPGPYEEAIIGTPILESVADEDLKGIDILRTIRSFDPCMPCTTHMDTGKGRITREINSCSCTLE